MDEPLNTRTRPEREGQDGAGDSGMDRAMALMAAERRLERARGELRGTMERLGALRRAALTGAHDADALDVAVLACRKAEAKVQAARQGLERQRTLAFGEPDAASTQTMSEASPAAPDEPEASPEPIVVTPRLLFARWLVQTGRLSEELAA